MNIVWTDYAQEDARELNMPPQTWFRGIWYAEQKIRELEAVEYARQARKERLMKIVVSVAVQILGGIGFVGAMCGYIALLWLMR